jgi:hypothetical protein
MTEPRTEAANRLRTKLARELIAHVEEFGIENAFGSCESLAAFLVSVEEEAAEIVAPLPGSRRRSAVHPSGPMTEPRTKMGRETLSDPYYAAVPGSRFYDGMEKRILAIELEAAELCTCDSYPDVCPFHSEKAKSAIPPDHHSIDLTHRCPDCGFRHCPECGLSA